MLPPPTSISAPVESLQSPANGKSPLKVAVVAAAVVVALQMGQLGS
jgi:hypothetical protein